MSINTTEAIRQIEEDFFDENKDFDILLKKVKEIYKASTSGSIANITGRIYEWIFAIDCLNYLGNNKGDLLVLKLPTISSLNIYDLLIYSDRIKFKRLQERLKGTHGINIITSNPDFIVLNAKKIMMSEAIKNFSGESLDKIDNYYRNYLGRIDVKSIYGFISLKSSLRPDRRLQIVHEATITKAIFDAIDNTKKINFISASLAHNEKDKAALNTVAIHTLHHENPVPAIDLTITMAARNDIKKLFDAMGSTREIQSKHNDHLAVHFF